MKRRDCEPPLAAVAAAVAAALAEDLLPIGDISAMLLDPEATASAAVVARRPGVVAGTACVAEVFARLDPTVEVKVRAGDGAEVAAGGVIAEVSGRLAPIVSGERTALNFLGHLSGVATLTAAYVAAAATGSPAARVWDTRKTTPGLRSLEKAAVRAGGGANHRGNLSEGVLIKDNHLGALSITEAVHRALERWPGRMVEVECDRLDQVGEAVAAGATLVLLDNMSPEEVRRGVEIVRGERRWAACLVEASGGINLDNVAAYAAAGADVISVGALTHSAPTLDVGLDLRS